MNRNFISLLKVAMQSTSPLLMTSPQASNLLTTVIQKSASTTLRVRGSQVYHRDWH